MAGPALDSSPSTWCVLGLSTAPADAAARERLCSLVAATTWSDEVWLSDDAVTAHAGALPQTAGVSLVAGTGVACLALRRDGEPRIIGGHGYLLGDEGGGFWIGRNGLRAALRSTDGRGPHTALAARATEQFGALSDLHVRLHDGERPVQAIASFAPAVLEAAAANDAVANAIVDDAARELYEPRRPCRRRVGRRRRCSRPRWPVAGTGHGTASAARPPARQ